MSRFDEKCGETFAAIYLPEFALQAVVSMEKSLEGKALIMIEEIGRKAVVAGLNERARRAGVSVGMTVPQALARSPEAVVRTRSSEKEKVAREALLTAAFMLSPRVEETGEGLCTVDLKGAPRDRLIERGERLVDELRKLGLEAKIGVARKPLVAFFAACRADRVLGVGDEGAFLGGLPISFADPSPRVAEVLAQWGVKTLGALAALPRQEIAKRLGEEGIALWDRAGGSEERVLRLTVLPEEFEQNMELERELERLDPLLFVLRRFIDQLSLRLGATCQAAEEVKLELGLTDHSKYERTFRLPEPSRDPELLFRMLHTHLEGVRTEFPIVKVRLWMQPCKPVSKQYDLFEAAVKDAYSFADTLARLVAVVGSGNVGSPRLEATHRPDAFRLEALVDIESRAEKADEAEKRTPEPRPMRRFRPAVIARVWVEEGRPAYLESEVFKGSIQKSDGPWRLSGDWWDRQRWSRTEWDIECADSGHYRLVHEKKNWFLEGEYE